MRAERGVPIKRFLLDGGWSALPQEQMPFEDNETHRRFWSVSDRDYGARI